MPLWFNPDSPPVWSSSCKGQVCGWLQSRSAGPRAWMERKARNYKFTEKPGTKKSNNTEVVSSVSFHPSDWLYCLPIGSGWLWLIIFVAGVLHGTVVVEYRGDVVVRHCFCLSLSFNRYSRRQEIIKREGELLWHVQRVLLFSRLFHSYKSDKSCGHGHNCSCYHGYIYYNYYYYYLSPL